LGEKYIKTENWLGSQIPLQTWFGNLAQNVQDPYKSILKGDNRVTKLPPIFVARVANIIPLMTLLDKIAKNEYDIKVLNNTQVKIQPKFLLSIHQ
jgi:hypothetical protein